MNDEQLSQPSDVTAEQRDNANGTGQVDENIGSIDGAVEPTASVSEETTATAETNQTGGPGGVIGGAGAPMPDWPPETEAAGTSSIVEDQATADTLTPYHPGVPTGGTPEQAAPEEVAADLGGADAQAPDLGAEGASAFEAQADAGDDTRDVAEIRAEGGVEAEAEVGTQEGAPMAGGEEQDELQVIRSTRDSRLNEMAPNASMEDLLRASEQQYRTLKHGDVVEGTVMKVDREEILIDIGAKSEGLIPSHELQSLTEEERGALQIGDTLLVSVVQPENQEGHAILSLDRARQERSWRDLQKKFEGGEVIQAQVSGYNKGGLLVNLQGVRGFVPSSQVSSIPPGEANKQAEMARLQGQSLPLKIIEINRARNRLILSERQAVQEERESRRSRLLRELEPGQVVEGRVSSICDFGAFVDVGGADGLVHLSELSWKRVNHPNEVLKVGDRINVQVLSVDPNERKIALSLKRTQPEPWTTITENYQLGQVVRGTITQLTSFGAFARLEDGIEGLIHVSELAEGRVAHPKNVVNVGDTLDLKVIRIDPARRRIGLSLKRMNEDLEGGAPSEGVVDEDTFAEARSQDEQPVAEQYAAPAAPATSPTPAPAPAPSTAAAPETARPPQREPSGRDRERERDRDRDRDRDRGRGRPAAAATPLDDDGEPLGALAAALAAHAQRTAASALETEEPTESGDTEPEEAPEELATATLAPDDAGTVETSEPAAASLEEISGAAPDIVDPEAPAGAELTEPEVAEPEAMIPAAADMDSAVDEEATAETGAEEHATDESAADLGEEPVLGASGTEGLPSVADAETGGADDVADADVSGADEAAPADDSGAVEEAAVGEDTVTDVEGDAGAGEETETEA
jgi:small subunit ribosomal protein S1